METLFIYLIKVSAGQILFYLLYWLLLRKKTLFEANRFFLLSGIIIPLILPLTGFHYDVQVSAQNTQNIFVQLDRTLQTFSYVDNLEETQTGSFSWINIIFIVYALGVVLLLTRLVWQNIMLLTLAKQNERYVIHGVKIVKNEKYELPFSYFNVVFIRK